ncbi:MAG: YlxR family protein [Firmicutes bacterium]|nr:YlxR family protein [Bacillota bacterium]
MTLSSDSHLPVRTCIGCKKRYTVDTLRRIAFIEPDTLTIGAGKTNGRGAWVCATDDKCLKMALSHELLSKKLRKKISSVAVSAIAEGI